MSHGSNQIGGQSSPIEIIHRRYGAWLKARLVRRYGLQDAEDLSQETWLRLVPYQACDDIRHPKALLLRIATNLAIDRFGRRAKRGRLVDEVSKLDGWGIELPAQTDELLARQIVLRLPQPLRDVFVLSRVGV